MQRWDISRENKDDHLSIAILKYHDNKLPCLRNKNKTKAAKTKTNTKKISVVICLFVCLLFPKYFKHFSRPEKGEKDYWMRD